MWSQVSGLRWKTEIPGGAFSAKDDFLSVPVSGVCFHPLEDSPVDVQRPFLKVLGWLQELLDPPKTWIPFSTSVKNEDFQVFASETPVGGTFGAAGGILGAFRTVFWALL